MSIIAHSARPTSRAFEILVALVLTLLAAGSVSIVHAHGYQLGALKIDHPWTRATPGGAKVAGGFMKITNTGTTPDRLIGGSLVSAGAFEIHEMRMDGDVMRMRRLEPGLLIPPGETVELRPGSFHVMFMQLSGGFKEGELINGTLVFEKAGTMDVKFKVEAIGARGAEHRH